MTPAADIARYRANWQGEIDSIALYQAIAALEAQPQLAEVYRRLAAAGITFGIGRLIGAAVAG